MLFSNRKGLKPIKSIFQVDSMNSELRNGLWNALTIYYWEKRQRDYPEYSKDKLIQNLIRLIQLYYFKETIDELPLSWNKNYPVIRQYFFGCEWYEVFDFIEFIIENSNFRVDYEEFEISKFI